MMDPYSAFAPHNRSSPESQYSGFPLMMSSGPIGPSGGNYEYRNISPVALSNYESFVPKALVCINYCTRAAEFVTLDHYQTASN